ncbi:MAG: protein kinase [Acidobacteriota bacterium]
MDESASTPRRQPDGPPTDSAARREQERFQRVKSLFARAVEQPPEERMEWLRRQTGDDDEMLRETLALLRSHDSAGDFLTASSQDLPARCTIGPYRTRRILGRGGMGTVYLASRSDDSFSKEVAIKLISRGGEVARRFVAERQILAGLEHPNIARLLDGGTSDGGFPYLVMEFVAGEPIDVWCDRRRRTLDQRLDLFLMACSATAYAHRFRVVHRDLKPSNILVNAEGQPKLLDFGIAKVVAPDPTEAVEQTATGLWAMTPEYASPEQLLGHPVTGRSDVYSLGVILYRLLTGRRPYLPATRAPAEMARTILAEPWSPPSQTIDPSDPACDAAAAQRSTDARGLRRALRGDLDTILRHALEPDPDRRYPSISDLMEDLNRHRQGLPIAVRRDSTIYRLGKKLRRNRWMAAALALVAVLVVAVAWQSLEADRGQRLAAQERARSEGLTRLVSDLLENDSLSAEGPLTLRELLDRRSEEVAEQLAEDLSSGSLVLEQLGRGYLQLGIRDRARYFLEQSLDRLRRQSDPDPSVRVAVLAQLASINLAEGEQEAARFLAREALAHFRRQPFDISHHAAEDLVSLSQTLERSGSADLAEAILATVNDRAPPEGQSAAAGFDR